MKYKIGDKVIAKRAPYKWRKPYVGKIGVIMHKAIIRDWVVEFEHSEVLIYRLTTWDEVDLEIARKPGQQLEFSFMMEEE